MKGIVFDLLERVVSNKYGDDTWDALLDDTKFSGVYTAVGSYPDEELVALVGAGARRLDVDPDALTRWFGSECIPLLARRFPAFFEPHTRTRSFLLTLNEVIHPEVRKLFPGAYAPSFAYEDFPDGALGLGYFSHRHLCAFAEGLIEGAAAHYHETVEIRHTTCTKRGDEKCALVIRFSGGA
jgi:hypothetical protein